MSKRFFLAFVIVASLHSTIQGSVQAGSPVIDGGIIYQDETHSSHYQSRQGDPWATVHGWIFRRYAGSVEMETKTHYPPHYFGRYTYRPWSPDWVNSPRHARSRQSQPPRITAIDETSYLFQSHETSQLNAYPNSVPSSAIPNQSVPNYGRPSPTGLNSVDVEVLSPLQ